jgi:hypothetical protein
MRTNTGLTMLFSVAAFGQSAPKVQTFPLSDTKGLVARNVTVEAADYKGRKAVRLTTDSPNGGFALLPGADFQDGMIEADFALKINAPPGARMPGFTGIAFRARPDASRCEMFYVRPGNSHAGDQAMRNHSVQYVSEPDYGWYRLRREWPFIYETHADLSPETWTHIKIEVAGRGAKLYMNGSAQPSLVVDGMKGEDLRGAVALWGYASEEAYFSNVRITNTAPEGVKNGADAAGAWQVRFNTDAGGFGGTLRLTRDGGKLTGTWSGSLGGDLPIAGTWRDGYIEVTFAGEWTKEMQMGAPGKSTVTMAGWIDGDAGKGRMKVEGRADGQWAATRKQ